MIRKNVLITLLIGLGGLCAGPIALAADYVEATPEKYQITLKKVELSKDGGNTWVTVGSGDLPFDIASAAAGAAAGNYISNTSLEAGVYNKMRATISRSFVIKSEAAGVVQQVGAYTNSGQILYTMTGGGSTTTAGSRAEQTVVCPSGGTLPTGITYDAAQDVFLDTRDISFSVSDKTTNGNVFIKFDVTNALRLYGDATFYPMPPTVTVTVTE